MKSDRHLADPLWQRLRIHGLGEERVAVAANQRLARAGEPIARLFFPLDAALLIARQTPLDPVPLPVALIGREAPAGSAALLESPVWSHDAIGLMPGVVMAVPADALRERCAADAALRTTLLRIAHNYQMQLAQSVVANLGHSVERRLARWLTMLDDRSAAATLAITHEQLAQLLNVRRATVTDAVHVLEGEGLIRNTRGRIQVRDRPALEQRAGQSYGFSECDYLRNIGPFGRLAVQPERG